MLLRARAGSAISAGGESRRAMLEVKMNKQRRGGNAESIAIIGMSGRFPGAVTLEDFWRNLEQGTESITRFSEEEMEAAGIEASVHKLPGYVNAGAVLDGIDEFDAVFFGFSARDAEVTDPQQRLFLECSWEAMEAAGYNPQGCRAPVSVFAGCDMSTYLY